MLVVAIKNPNWINEILDSRVRSNTVLFIDGGNWSDEALRGINDHLMGSIVFFHKNMGGIV
ncbi:hypothetical protein NS383_17745 [Pseudomonas oryzihabitans]|nr:hypothetical protein NS383_17745 [Pseudomonas psychrotolerans]